MVHIRQCMYCKTPIAECMGSVLFRDVLAALEGTMPADQYPRELCNTNFECQERWAREFPHMEETKLLEEKYYQEEVDMETKQYNSIWFWNGFVEGSAYVHLIGGIICALIMAYEKSV